MRNRGPWVVTFSLLLGGMTAACGPVKIPEPTEVGLTGRVVRGEPAEPVPATVRAVGRSYEAGGDGGFLLEGLPPGGVVDVEVRSTGCPAVLARGLHLPLSGRLDLGDILVGPVQRLEVIAVDLAGRPVEGAVVEIRSEWRRPDRWWERRLPWDDPPGPVFTGRTGPGGIAPFPETPPGDWAVLVEAEGFARSVRKVEVRQGVVACPRIALDPGNSLRGVLVGPGGRARAGATLFAGCWDSTVPHPLAHSRAVTDAEGRYSFTDLPAGPVRIRLFEDGHLRDIESFVVPGVAEADLHLEGSAGLEGRVVDGDTGVPVEGAQVSGTVRDPDGRFDLVRTRSDRAGRFTVQGLMPGRLEHLTAERSGLLPGTPVESAGSALTLREGRSEVVDIELRRGHGVLRGRVEGDGGRPMPWVRVGVGTRGPVRTDRSGEFVLFGQEAGRVYFEVDVDGWKQPGRRPDHGWDPSSTPDSVEIPEQGEAIKVLRLVRAPGTVWHSKEPPGEIQVGGRILDEEGRPVPGADLRLLHTSDPRPLPAMDRELLRAAPIVVDGEGRFRIEGLLPTDFARETLEPGQPKDARWIATRSGACLAVRAPGRQPALIPLWESLPAAPGSGLDIVLEADRPVAGRVVDAEGRPIPGARVGAMGLRPEDPDQSRFPRYYEPAVAVTGEDGSFRISGLDRARWRLAARADGFLDGGGAAALPGDREVTITLVRPLPIAGLLVDPSGGAMEGVLVRATLSRSNSSADPDSTGISDDRGGFRLECLPGEAYEVRIRPTVERNFLPVYIQKVQAGTGDLRVVLSPGLMVAGTVLDPRGRPVRGLALQATPESPSARPSVHGGGVMTDRQGRFRIPGLPPGRVRLSQPHSTGHTPEFRFDATSVDAGKEDIVLRAR